MEPTHEILVQHNLVQEQDLLGGWLYPVQRKLHSEAGSCSGCCLEVLHHQAFVPSLQVEVVPVENVE